MAYIERVLASNILVTERLWPGNDMMMYLGSDHLIFIGRGVGGDLKKNPGQNFTRKKYLGQCYCTYCIIYRDEKTGPRRE